MKENTWLTQITAKNQELIARKSIKYCYPNSRIMGPTFNDNGEFECCLFFNVGEKKSSQLVFHEYNIDGSFIPSGEALNSIYRTNIMTHIAQKDRMEYLTNAMIYLSKEASADMIAELSQAKLDEAAALDELAKSEYDILSYSTPKHNSAFEQIKKKYSLDSRIAKSNFVESSDALAEDLAYSYASSFVPKTQGEFDTHYTKALDTLHDLVANSEMGE